jgi:hypothetical protein
MTAAISADPSPDVVLQALLADDLMAALNDLPFGQSINFLRMRRSRCSRLSPHKLSSKVGITVNRMP